MVPMPDSSYFPPLDKCLDGEQLLISWKSVFPAIQSSTDGTVTSTGTSVADPQHAIQRFLSDPVVRELLASPFDIFLPPTPQSKSAFETKTSAINVTPSSNARYDVKQIKDDALWFSKVAKLDEVSALRLVVQEYQSRASTKLLGPLSEDELVSIRESAGDSKFSSPVALSLLSRGADAADIQVDFETEDNRRSRILLTYLSERRYLLKCVERFLHAFFIDDLRESGNGKGKGADTLTWVADVGRAMVNSIGSLEDFALRCFEAIETNIQNIGKGSGWNEEGSGRADLEFEWVCTQIMEATHTMESIFQAVFFNTNLPSSQLVLGWFRLLQSCGFFDQFNMEEPSVQVLVLPLQGISMLVSLSVLGVGSALDYLEDNNSDAVVSSDMSADVPFILNTQTILEIHQIMMDAAGIGFITAGPPILAWVTILKAMKQRIWDNRTLQLEEGERLTEFENQAPNSSEPALVPDQYESVMEDITNSSDEDDPVDFLAQSSVNRAHALETLASLAMRLGNTSDSFFSNTTGVMMRVNILDLIRASNNGLGYIPEVVEALLSTLSAGQGYWDLARLYPHSCISDPIATFLGDEYLIAAFLKNAMSRYPLEPLPFLRMIRALTSSPSTYHKSDTQSVLGLLDNIPYFTYQLPSGFIDYETAQEEENNNTVRLKVPVHLFDSPAKSIHQIAPSQSLALTLADDDFCIPAGSYGRIISDSGPKVVFWYHEYSGLKYFGTLLETFLTASPLVDATTGLPADRDSVIEIIDILATIILGISKSITEPADAKKDATHVLEIASSGLSRNRDIITVIFDIFEEELQTQLGVSTSAEAPLGVLISCVHFIHAIIPVSSARVWPHLARSALLGVSRNGGRLPIIVEGIEVVTGRYEFLLSCSRLYEALVEDIASNAVKRRSGPKSAGRFEDREDVGTGVPDQLLSKIMLFFTRYLIDTLESSFSWKFIQENERRYLFKSIPGTFDKLLHYVYGIEPTLEPAKTPKTTPESVERPPKIVKTASKAIDELTSKVTGALIASASQIVDSFLATSTSALRFQPLLIAYMDGVKTSDLTIFLNELDLWQSHVNAVLMFSTTLLRVSSFLHRPTSQLEGQMFKAAPLLARLYSASDAYKKSVLGLFGALIVTANDASDPPSLLGHLSPHTAKSFVHILSNLDRPLARDDNVVAIWNFLATVVSNKQRWLANYLLTGKTPKEAFRRSSGSKEQSVLDKPLLTTALETLSGIENIPKARALGMLEFVALAQNFWPWIVYSSPKHGAFYASLLRFVGSLKPIQQSTRLEDLINACFQTKIAACIAEILAMHMFHARQTGSHSPVNKVIADLEYFIRFAVQVPYLNSSLHTLLKRNFEARYPGCIPQDLKRTTLEDRQLGNEYFYDLSLADKMLGRDAAWTGRRDNGLRAEFENANANLSLVDSQIALFQGWKVLAIEISNNPQKDTEVQRALIKVATDSLVANSKSQFSEEIFSRLCLQRADFALVLTQRLMEAKCTLPEMKGLLTKTWATIRAFRGTFEKPLRQEDAPYYRSLLKILFVAIRAHTTSAGQENLNASVRIAQSAPLVPVILDIIKYVVAMGMRESVSSIHENPAESSPEDIALITGILQSCLRVPEIELSQAQIVSTIMANNTARIATTLFSWSDSISVDGDPIYGELSILFLLELSSMPLMAEQLAIEGVLGHIASTNITTYLRGGNVNPFADSAGLQRCYNIWVRGILPFILNLLDAVQTSIAAEVANFLNQFSPLLKQNSKAFEVPESTSALSKTQPKYISISICSEAQSLALISYILNGFREDHPGTPDIPELKWDAAATLENVEFWLGAPSLLKEKIVPMGGREAELAKQRTDSGTGYSKLENNVLSEMMGIRDILSGSDGS